jgi:hypothetical protein
MKTNATRRFVQTIHELQRPNYRLKRPREQLPDASGLTGIMDHDIRET